MKPHRLLTLLAFIRNSCSGRINQQILCTLRMQDCSGLSSISSLQAGWNYHIEWWHYLLKIRIEDFRFTNLIIVVINFTIENIFFIAARGKVYSYVLAMKCLIFNVVAYTFVVAEQICFAIYINIVVSNIFPSDIIKFQGFITYIIFIFSYVLIREEIETFCFTVDN